VARLPSMVVEGHPKIRVNHPSHAGDRADLGSTGLRRRPRAPLRLCRHPSQALGDGRSPRKSWNLRNSIKLEQPSAQSWCTTVLVHYDIAMHRQIRLVRSRHPPDCGRAGHFDRAGVWHVCGGRAVCPAARLRRRRAMPAISGDGIALNCRPRDPRARRAPQLKNPDRRRVRAYTCRRTDIAAWNDGRRALGHSRDTPRRNRRKAFSRGDRVMPR
jgi:hypothetical protein